jgi:hypothetical protein
MSMTTLYGKWPLGVPMVSQKRRQMAPWCPNGVPTLKSKWSHGVPMVSLCRQSMSTVYADSLLQMAPWCPFGVPTLKANGPMVSLWCPYAEEQN